MSTSLCLRRSSAGKQARHSEVWLASAEELLASKWATAAQPQALLPRTRGGRGWATTCNSVPDARRDNPNSILQRLGRGIVCY